jgi:hypothetical protein
MFIRAHGAACTGGTMAGRAIAAIAVLAGSLLWTQAMAQSSGPQPSVSPAKTSKPSLRPGPNSGLYFIEFRAARIGLYGHSYVAYGRLDARGNPAKTDYADLHPMGGYGVMALGHFVPVPGNTEWDPEVLTLPVAYKYRVNLDDTQFKNLQVALQGATAKKLTYWNAVSNNCNHFVGELAQAVGLRVPAQFHLSYGFIPDLQEINQSNPVSQAAPTRQRTKRTSAAASPVAAR